MAEKEPQVPAEPALTSSEVPPKVEVSPPKESNESFLGTMLIVILLLILVGVVGFFSFVGYRVWRANQLVKATPSIERIVVEEPAPVAEPAPSPEAPSTETPPPAPAIDKALLEVKVLNGGAAKGSAGTLVETLKKSGYSKAAFGNTIGDYAGTIIYFAEGKEADAEVLKADVMKTYPAVTTAKAIASNKDSTAAPLVVILGK